MLACVVPERPNRRFHDINVISHPKLITQQKYEHKTMLNFI